MNLFMELEEGEFVKQIKKPVIANEIIFSTLYCKEKGGLA